MEPLCVISIDSQPYGQTYIPSIVSLSSNDEKKVSEISQYILKILQLPNDIDIQNGLEDLLEQFDIELDIPQIYKERKLITYGYKLSKTFSDSVQLGELIEQIEQQEPERDVHLSQLLQSYKQKSQLQQAHDHNRGIQKRELILKDISEIGELTNEKLKSLTKQNIYFDKKPNYVNFRTNAITLPQNARRVNKEGYEEIYIPHNANLLKGENCELLSVQKLPMWQRNCFGDVNTFNNIQSRCFEYIYGEQGNGLICAPTGAGKTIIAVFGILGLINRHLDEATSTINKEEFKIVYLAPMKALVREIVQSLQIRLKSTGVEVAECTGEENLSQQEFQKINVIVATPEKWDVITRKQFDKQVTNKLRLLIVDEVHLLGDTRGAVLEALIMRHKQLGNVRIIALSATLPNYKDVADFIKVPEEGVFYFDNRHRPVPLHQLLIGVNEPKMYKRMQQVRSILFEKVSERVQFNQLLVFVHSRKEAFRTAMELREDAFSGNVMEIFMGEHSQEILQQVSAQIQNQELKDIIANGIGVHHAGLTRSDRSLVEDLFSQGHLSVLISTATLAWGINLPAHTVIIKNTQVYSPTIGEWTSLGIQDLLQMLGRAGRPIYDTEGEGIVITTKHELTHYLSILNEQQPIESTFLYQFSEHLNAEIAGGNIHSFQQALLWLLQSYFYIRVRKQPKLYNIIGDANDPNNVLYYLSDVIHSSANELSKAGLIEYDVSQSVFMGTEFGKIASHYYIKPENVSVYKQWLRPTMNVIDILKLFTLSSEFKDVIIRDDQKAELHKLYQQVPIPIKTPIDDPKTKINILLQCFFSNAKMEGYAINCDQAFISQNAQRIFRALFEMSLYQKFASAEILLSFSLMSERKQWSVLSPLRQFDLIPLSIINRIEAQEQLSFENLRNLSLQQIRDIIRNDENTELVYQALQNFPSFKLAVTALTIHRKLLKLAISISPDFQWSSSSENSFLQYWLFITDVNNQYLLYHQPLELKRPFFTLPGSNSVNQNYCLQVNVDVQLPNILQPYIYVKLISNNFLGPQSVLPVSLTDAILPNYDKLTIQNINYELDSHNFNNITQQEHDNLRFLMQNLNITNLSALQRNTYQLFSQSQKNIFIGAFPNSGKFTISLLALIEKYRNKQNDQNIKKTIIIVPEMQALEEKKEILLRLFQHTENLSISQLTGHSQHDNTIMKQSQIILSTASHFESYTKNFRKKKILLFIDTIIITNAQNIGFGNMGYETSITRLLILSKLNEQKSQFIILSTPLLNASTIGQWLNIEKSRIINFSLLNSNRQIVYEYISNDFHNIQNFVFKSFNDIKHICQRRAQNYSNFVIVPNLHFAKILISQSTNFHNYKGSIFQEENEQFQQFDDIFIREMAKYGICYFSSSLSENDQSNIIQLQKQKKLQFILITIREVVELKKMCPSTIIVLEHQTEYEIQEIDTLFKNINVHDDINEIKKVIIISHTWRKSQLKQLFEEPRVVESAFTENILELLIGLLSSQSVTNEQQFMDYLTWSFYYRCVQVNPNYYSIPSNSPNVINSYLSELVQASFEDAVQAGFATFTQEKYHLSNIGIIATAHGLKCDTMRNIVLCVDSSPSLKSIIFTISQSSEFYALMLNTEDFSECIFNSSPSLPWPLDCQSLSQSESTIYAIIIMYLNRCDFGTEPDINDNIKKIIPIGLKVVNAFVDYASEKMQLNTALLSMKLSQMFVQQLWIKDSSLKQLPHFDENMLLKCQDMGISTLDDFFEITDDARRELFQNLTQAQIEEIALYANSFPNISIEAQFSRNSPFPTNSNIQISVNITNDNYSECQVIQPTKFCSEKEEYWWLFIGDKKRNKLFYIKKQQMGLSGVDTINFKIEQQGKYSLSVFLVNDSFSDFDLEFSCGDIEIMNDQFS